MKEESVMMNGTRLTIYSLNTIVVGSGAAGLNAAKRLHDFGQQDIAILTEGLKKGTSRNTGSDKQTYYKMSLSGAERDSIYEVALTLFSGGAMHGPIALVEAALSLRSFFHLVELGVPFPHTAHGEYIGYKTDHDPRHRGTSAGPLTSHYMTERLEERVREKGIEIFSGFKVIGVLRDEERALGVMALNIDQCDCKDERYVLFNAKNTVYATGGPAEMYSTSVYPESQTGAIGAAFEAGIRGRNLTESQFGLGSIGFRWNLSGTYQQVLPRYVSTDKEGGDEREFLLDYFPAVGTMLDAVFLKGYQWPFDSRKVRELGSSIIDLLVYNEMVKRGRRIWLDFTSNPQGLMDEEGNIDFTCLGGEAYLYLESSGALFGRPIDRLKKMNQPAVDLYREKGIDLEREYLEIAVCAQHNNGGLAGNHWWESNVKGFFPVGEVNGSHGIYRPGGSALNSGQVGSLRAAEYIAHAHQGSVESASSFMKKVEGKVLEILHRGELFLSSAGEASPMKMLQRAQEKMTAYGGHIRTIEEVKRIKGEFSQLLAALPCKIQLKSSGELPKAFELYDTLVAQFVYLSAIEEYILKGGKSRGSYLIVDPCGERLVPEIPERYGFHEKDDPFQGMIQEIEYDDHQKKCHVHWVSALEIPKDLHWFEEEWKKFRQGEIYQ